MPLARSSAVAFSNSCVVAPSVRFFRPGSWQSCCLGGRWRQPWPGWPSGENCPCNSLASVRRYVAGLRSPESGRYHKSAFVFGSISVYRRNLPSQDQSLAHFIANSLMIRLDRVPFISHNFGYGVGDDMDSLLVRASQSLTRIGSVLRNIAPYARSPKAHDVSRIRSEVRAEAIDRLFNKNPEIPNVGHGNQTKVEVVYAKGRICASCQLMLSFSLPNERRHQTCRPPPNRTPPGF